MKLRRLAATAATGAMIVGGTLGFASPASAGRCDPEVRFLGRQVVTVGVNPAQFHLDVRKVAGAENLWSIWVYHETNSTGGLQRGADAYLDRYPTAVAGPFGDEPCEANPDTVVL